MELPLDGLRTQNAKVAREVQAAEERHKRYMDELKALSLLSQPASGEMRERLQLEGVRLAQLYNEFATTPDVAADPQLRRACFARALLAIPPAKLGSPTATVAQALYQLGNAHLEQGRLRDAAKCLRRAGACDLTCGALLAVKSHVNLSVALDRQGDHESALGSAHAALELIEHIRGHEIEEHDRTTLKSIALFNAMSSHAFNRNPKSSMRPVPDMTRPLAASASCLLPAPDNLLSKAPSLTRHLPALPVKHLAKKKVRMKPSSTFHRLTLPAARTTPATKLPCLIQRPSADEQQQHTAVLLPTYGMPLPGILYSRAMQGSSSESAARTAQNTEDNLCAQNAGASESSPAPIAEDAYH